MPNIVTMAAVMAGAKDAVIASWSVKVGDKIAEGEVLAEVETDKALVDLESEVSGTVRLLAVEPGSRVGVGQPIAVIASASDEEGAIDAAIASVAKGTDAMTVTVPDPTPGPTMQDDAAPERPKGNPRIFSTPIARKLAADNGIDFNDVQGSGPRGRITRVDIEAQLAQRPPRSTAPDPAPGIQPESTGSVRSSEDTARDSAAPSKPGIQDGTRGTQVPVTRLREAIARRLTESKQTIPHYYLQGSADVQALLALRTQLNSGNETKVSVNDFVVLAAARALMVVPEMNCSWSDSGIWQFNSADLAVAVSTDSGLFTPVIRDVECMTVRSLSAAIKAAAERASTGRLRQSELEGGSLTISNLGMFGVENFSAIINPPHSAILAVGKATEVAVVQDGQLTVGVRMSYTLSVDHRVVDGSLAARWLQAFTRLLESPLDVLSG